MKLVFKQKFFSWFDSFDVFDEAGQVVYTVQGKLSWGHMFVILDRNGREIGSLKERVFSFLHTFDFRTNECSGSIRKEISFFSRQITVDSDAGYSVEGDYLGWDYSVTKRGIKCARLRKELFNFTDTYIIDCNPEDSLACVLILLAIDAINCDHKN